MVLNGLAAIDADVIADAAKGVARQLSRGSSAPHAQWSTAVLVGLEGPVTVELGDRRLVGRVIVVPPNCQHVTSSRGPRVDIVLDADVHRATTRALAARDPFATTDQALVAAVERSLRSKDQDQALHQALDSVAAVAPIGPAPLRDARVARLVEGDVRDLSLRAWAQREHVTPSHLSRTFHAAMGIPLRRWLAWRRLLQALAAARSMPLVHAAAEAGFADQAHFTRTCVKLMGHLPTVLTRGWGGRGPSAMASGHDRAHGRRGLGRGCSEPPAALGPVRY